MDTISVISVREAAKEDMQTQIGPAPAIPIGIAARDQQAGVQILVWEIMQEPGAELSIATVTARPLHRPEHRFTEAVLNRSYRFVGCAADAGYLLIQQADKEL